MSQHAASSHLQSYENGDYACLPVLPLESKAPPLSTLTYGIASRAMPGQTESGDGSVVIPQAAGTLVGVLDGLGHGPLAAAATKAAQTVLESDANSAGDDLPTLIRACHTQLTGTRCVVMTLAFFSATSPIMTWLGVGNVEGSLLRADARYDSTRVVLRGGVVGGSLPSLHSSTVTLAHGDLLILSTDGIKFYAAADIDRNGEPQQIADELFEASAKTTDDALLLVARWNGES